MITNIFVTAAPEREVPIPTSEATAPGGELLRCFPGKVYRLPNTTYTRKRLASGDLLLCDRAGKLVSELELAAAPDVHELDSTGAVEQLAPAAPVPAPAPAPAPTPVVDLAAAPSTLPAGDNPDAPKGL